MTSLLNIFLGVVSGVITYLVIEAVVQLFKKSIIPWYQGVIYRGKNINGEWEGYNAKMEGGVYTQDPESESTINIIQKGNKAFGELLLTKQPNGEKCRKIFEFKGHFVDTILVAEVQTKDNNNMGVGTLVLKLTENGEKLKGIHTYVSAYDWSTITNREQVWIRKSTVHQN